MKRAALGFVGVVLWAGVCAAGAERAHLDTEGLPRYLRDRGTGVPSSVFGTYVQPGQFLVYPFFEYVINSNAEYNPADYGYVGEQDYRGELVIFEELLFLGYGISDRWSVEMEAAITQTSLEKSPEDTSNFPNKLEESGLGDVELQLRYRWTHETESHPEVFSYFEPIVPTQDEGSLIGTTDWEFKFGTGLVRGFGFGTMSARAAIEYTLADEKLEVGEVAIEYLRRLSPTWRVFAAVEGTQDEYECIQSAQWHFTGSSFVHLVNAFGLTSKANDWAPEIGVMFGF